MPRTVFLSGVFFGRCRSDTICSRSNVLFKVRVYLDLNMGYICVWILCTYVIIGTDTDLNSMDDKYHLKARSLGHSECDVKWGV